jgi:hypothetical protein
MAERAKGKSQPGLPTCMQSTGATYNACQPANPWYKLVLATCSSHNPQGIGTEEGLELFGTHWCPGAANKTRMMITERWIPSLLQRCMLTQLTPLQLVTAFDTVPLSCIASPPSLGSRWHEATAPTHCASELCHHCFILPSSAQPLTPLVPFNIHAQQCSSNSLQHTSTHTILHSP